MSHFYSGIEGSRGPATRQGTEASGISSYVQGWGTRISSAMHVNRSTGKDSGGVRFGCGPSNYNGGALAIDFDNLDDVVNALAIGDPKMERLRTRIYEAVKAMDAEAPKALARAERKRKRAERQQAKLDKKRQQQRVEILKTLKGEEKARLTRLVGLDWDQHGNLERSSTNVMTLVDINLRYSNPDSASGFLGHILITARPKGAHQKYDFDVTAGQWVLPFEPEELGIDLSDTGFGYRCEVVPA